MTLIARVSEALGRSEIAHTLIGAGALAAHGVARSTADIDLLTTHPASLEENTWRELRSARVRVEIRRLRTCRAVSGFVGANSARERRLGLTDPRAGPLAPSADFARREA